MDVNITKIPPNLRDYIISQPHTFDGDSYIYICGCYTDGGRERWVVCDRHQSTLYQAGRMLNG